MLRCARAAAKYGGSVIAVGGGGTTPKVNLRCKAGHIWWSRVYSGLLAGHWCGECFNGARQRSLAEMRELAKKRGGKCLSKRYVNRNTPMQWECALGHRWIAPASGIISGRWCDSCSRGISERVCRAWFEKAFGVAFHKIRPQWLLNSRGKRMELDGYSAELGLAFEYNGVQHYKRNVHFHNHPVELQQRIADDYRKKKLSAKHGVVLVIIPYYYELRDYYLTVSGICRSHKLPIPQNIKEIELEKISSPQKLLELQNSAKKRGGKCLSTQFMGVTRKHLWECGKGHVWESTPVSVVKAGNWCAICSKKKKHTIEEMREYAVTRGWVCLSSKYESSHAKLLWRCNKGHVFSAPWTGVSQGHGCPVCDPTRQKTIEEMRNFAKHHGWECLSDKYSRKSDVLQWKCHCGHVWKQTWDKIRYRKICPNCMKGTFGKVIKWG